MLLYHLRKAAGLDEEYFATTDAASLGCQKPTPPVVKHLVFIDDLCGTGRKVTDYDAEIVMPIRARFGNSIDLSYFVMFATTTALEALRPPATGFDKVEAVHELDSSFNSFGPTSRYFPTKNSTELSRIALHRPMDGGFHCTPLAFAIVNFCWVWHTTCPTTRSQSFGRKSRNGSRSLNGFREVSIRKWKIPLA